MSGALNMKAKLNIPPGKESVTQKIGVRGHFVLTNIHFSNPDVEDKVDMLSLRAQGKPGEAHPGAPDVHSQMRGAFDLHSGRMDYQRTGLHIARRLGPTRRRIHARRQEI